MALEAEGSRRTRPFRRGLTQVRSKYYIFRSRYSRAHKPSKEARVGLQMLSPSQENVIEDGVCYSGAMGLPLGVLELRRIVEVVSEGTPSKSWVYQFRDRHRNLPFRLAASLDQKRGSAFNQMIVKDCFGKISKHQQNHKTSIRVRVSASFVSSVPIHRR